jgi:hypothetical protein
LAGDICLDVATVPIPGLQPAADSENWQLIGGLQTYHIPDGEMFLARLISCATGEVVAGPVLTRPDDLKNGPKDTSPLSASLMERLTRKDIVHSMLSLVEFFPFGLHFKE